MPNQIELRDTTALDRYTDRIIGTSMFFNAIVQIEQAFPFERGKGQDQFNIAIGGLAHMAETMCEQDCQSSKHSSSKWFAYEP